MSQSRFIEVDLPSGDRGCAGWVFHFCAVGGCTKRFMGPSAGGDQQVVEDEREEQSRRDRRRP